MQEILSKIDFSRIDAEYADVRIEQTQETTILFEKEQMKQASVSPSCGAFLRVLKNGNWAYRATTDLSNLQADLIALVAKTDLLPPKQGVKWPKREANTFHAQHYEKSGSHNFSLEQKKTFCESLLPIFTDEPLVQGFQFRYADMYKQKWFRSSDNIEFSYDYSQAGGGVFFSIKEGEKFFEDYISFFIRDPNKDLNATVAKLKAELEENKSFLDAPSIEPGKYTVVLDPGVTGVFTHESFGHKSEADFMLGDEAMKAEWEIGKKVGSDILNIVDDGNWPDTSGYVPIDDEGNMKQKTYLIKDGKLAGRLHSTMTAVELDEAPTGNARAKNFQFDPIVRMTNTYIEGGAKDFDEMIGPITKGVFLKGYKHGMGMSTFTIAPRKAFMIENGRITTPVNVSVLSGNVFETLNNIVDLGKDFDIHSGATGGCGKMEQWPLPVADGGPSIVVENMTLS